MHGPAICATGGALAFEGATHLAPGGMGQGVPDSKLTSR